MKRILLLSMVFSFVFATSAWAQRTVAGKVTDESGEGLPGVNVVIKGTTTGVTTDLDGNYQISVPDDNTVLVFSSVGMATQEIEVGSRTAVDINMLEDSTKLEEVIVTGMAIEREKREIGYGISQVSGDELTVARESNILNSLQGKTTGVLINQSGGNLGGSSQIFVRGFTSLAGNNNPLWVVDGVPINNSTNVSSSPGENGLITGQRDFFNGAAVINPDDVESISILKGAAATALYGSRAAAGAVIVTTKRGKGGAGGPSVTLNSSYRIDRIFRVPDLQYEYSGGSFGRYDSSAVGAAWGVKIDGQGVRKAITNEDVQLKSYEDNWKDFYEDAWSLINNVSVEDRTEKGDYRLSVTSLLQEGILPASRFERITSSFNAGTQHNKWLSTRFGFTYVRSGSEGTGAVGANEDDVVDWTSFTPTTDIKDHLPWIDETGQQININASPTVTFNNIFWNRNENLVERDNDRLITNFEAKVTPFENFDFLNRVGYDFESDGRLLTKRIGTIGAAQGEFLIDKFIRTQFNYDGILSHSRTFSDIKVKALVGFNYNRRVTQRETLFAQNLAVVNLFNPANAQSTVPSRDYIEQLLVGVYSELSMTYKNWLTLTVTGRNDWSSTLPIDNYSYFYPSVNTSFVFTDAFGISNDVLSYGKLRASWAKVGNAGDPYQLLFTFAPQATANGQYGANLLFPYRGALGFSKSNIIPNTDLVPEEQTSYEFGTELQFFDGRFSLDVAYFNSVNENQILDALIPSSTGFRRQTKNAGSITTKGLEMTLDATVLQAGDFSWNTAINYSSIEVSVSELGTQDLTLQTEFSSISVRAVDGGSIELFAIPYKRDETTNRPLINAQTGLREAGEVRSFGSIFPDFTWGFVNTMKYKGLSLRFTIDGRVGGVLRSGTVAGLWGSGFATETTENRFGAVIDRSGVIDNGDGTVRDNDVPVRSTETFWRNLAPGNVAEHTIFDADFIKLREVAISYMVPKQLVDATPFKRIQVGVEGRNLLLLYSKVPHIDPEANIFGASGNGFGLERSSVPSTRSFGVNLQLAF